MKKFKLTLSHDSGKINITVMADSEQQARDNVMRAEGCPARAITKCVEVKQKIKVKTIDIQAKEWFDKVNGNSYFAGEVTVNYGLKSQTTFKIPFQYGYGNQYEQEAREILAREGIIGYYDYGKNGKDPHNLYELREQGIIIRSDIQRNCKKRELMKY